MAKERPFPLSGPEVRAILDGHKTQVRRVLPCQPDSFGPPVWWAPEPKSRPPSEDKFKAVALRRCRYGQPGDRLWVRETWRTWDEDASEPIYDDDTGMCIGEDGYVLRFVAYQATPRKGMRAEFGGFTATTITFLHESSPIDGPDGRHLRGPWRSPACMPRWASRLTLEVTDVRVQRLHEISNADKQAEGLPADACYTPLPGHLGNFEVLWNALHGKHAPWASNPWVWALTFKVVRHG